MLDFYNFVDNKELEEKLASTESSDVIKYIYNLDENKQKIFFQRLEKIYGKEYIEIMKEAVKYLNEG